MAAKRVLSIVLVASAVVLAVGVGPRFTGTARALPVAQQAGLEAATIPYSGRLTDDRGQPVADGAYDFAFALYEAAEGGATLWAETQTGVAVRGGAFTAALGSVSPLQAPAPGRALWLEVGVRGPGEAEFTLLAPRQALSAAASAAAANPSAGPACAHDHWGESWGDANFEVAFPGPFVALYGHSDAYGGVMGQSTGNIAVYGSSTNSTGVYGQSTNGYGGVFEGSGTGLQADISLVGDPGRIVAYDGSSPRMSLRSDGNIVANIDSDNTGDNFFYVSHDPAALMLCEVNEAGDLACIGTKSAIVDTQQYGRRKMYAVESPEVWLEDVGTARLAEGETNVAFEPIFAQTVNLEEDYHVFLTPLSGEPVLLYVTAKHLTAFTVRGVTLDGEPAACSFDYRIVAKRLGYEDVRLEPASGPRNAE